MGEEEEKPEEETELPATPSAGVGRATPVPQVEVEDPEETPNRAGPSSMPATYQPAWDNIFEDILLNSPLLREEWVARALFPFELRPFARAETFEIYDIANRAAMLVRL